MNKQTIILGSALALSTIYIAPSAAAPLSHYSQTPTTSRDSVELEETLSSAVVTARRAGTTRMTGAENAMRLSRTELFKAACCNLGESFTTNPSVDVSYSDAATGARQIKLLGLAGIYVQMLAETLPDFRGVAAPYALGYVPGPWMKSIQVSKGAASVKNGYESITGQINIDYKKPEDEQGAEVNLYTNTMGRVEANVDANVHLAENLSTELLLHHENSLWQHDGNDDGFMDAPRVEQYNVQNRWYWKQGNYLFHGGLSALKEIRRSGETTHSCASDDEDEYLPYAKRFDIRLHTNRYAGYMKHAVVLDADHGTNIALMSSATMHQLAANYGLKGYHVNEKNLYASLMFETNFTDAHNLSLGLSLNHDYLSQKLRATHDRTLPYTSLHERETTPGAYAQYTYSLADRVTAMAGVRIDHSSKYGTFVTPRFHLKYRPADWLSLRASAGKGYRTVHALAENNYLLASGRQLVIDDLEQEAAWNYGLSAALDIPLFGKTLKVNAEYYYTDFLRQAVIDYDSSVSNGSAPYTIHITNLRGDSYSHTFQIDATYPVLKGLNLTAAWRYNDVRCTYGGVLRSKPLTSRYKALLTASYSTPLKLWQFDATLQLNGGGRMPEPYVMNNASWPLRENGQTSWPARFKAYEQVSAQVTRWFRHWTLYVGGENLTVVRQHRPIVAADSPWSSDFEPTLVWGPTEGAVFYIGARINILRDSF